MNVLAIANQKGGTAKTTTAAALGLLLSRTGVPTHLIDMDPQASLTSAFGHHDPDGLLYHALRDAHELPVIRIGENLTLTPSSIDLSRGETEFVSEAGREFLLKRALDNTDCARNAVIIIDCPPSLGVLAINCLSAAHSLCVVVQPGGFELRALVHLEKTVGILRERVNSELTIVGVILTNCHQRRLITAQVESEIRRHYRMLGRVRTDARLLYATTEGRLHKLRVSPAFEDYSLVLTEIMEALPWARSQLAESKVSSVG